MSSLSCKFRVPPGSTGPTSKNGAANTKRSTSSPKPKPSPSLPAHRWCILLTTFLAFATLIPSAHACAAVTRDGSLVVNADQTVIMIWDRAARSQHFIRQANFKTDAPDVGFIVPSPSRPQLAEAGNPAFTTLAEITAPYVRGGGFSIGCSAPTAGPPRQSSVRVIEQKRVAGYDTTVLTARSGADLVEWLQNNGYPNSPETAAWAAPYLGGDWHFSAMKVAKQETRKQDINAAALRITFRTTRPIFPYREPDSAAAMRELNAPERLLRIHFIADARYRGAIDGGGAWTGKAVWADDITPHRDRLLRELKLPASTGPNKWILTEFEDRWPYAKATGDLYFSKDPDQSWLDTRSTFAPPPRDAALLGAIILLCAHRLGRRR